MAVSSKVEMIVLALISALAGSLICQWGFPLADLSMDSLNTQDPFPLIRPSNNIHTMELDLDEEDAISWVREIPEHVTSCLEQRDNCPFYPDGQLERDWPVRYMRSNRKGCYFEFNGVSPSCPQVCDELFSENSLNGEIGRKIGSACKIGCGYATRSFESRSKTCHRNCKATIWNFDESDSKCSEDKGLGLTIANFEISKACEIGCLIANERPCPKCEERAVVNDKTIDA